MSHQKKDENHVDIGGVKLEIRPDRTTGLLTDGYGIPVLQTA